MIMALSLTNPHNFTLDASTEHIYEEFKELARKEHTNITKLVRIMIREYVEARSAKVVKDITPQVPLLTNKVKLLTYRRLNPHPKDSPNYPKWEKMYGK